MSINEEIIATAEKMHELCYTMNSCEDCPLESIGCNMGLIPMEWELAAIKKAKSPR